VPIVAGQARCLNAKLLSDCWHAVRNTAACCGMRNTCIHKV